MEMIDYMGRTNLSKVGNHNKRNCLNLMNKINPSNARLTVKPEQSRFNSCQQLIMIYK